jgi:uncharacterized caspase-like protein
VAVLCAVLALPAAAAEKRVAFVVGIDRYDHLADGLQLKKAANDAKAVGDTLRDLGYEVVRAENVGRVELLRQWSRFLNMVEPGSTAAFFFAGHGVEIGGVNYLIPRDVPRVGDGEEELLKGSAIKLDMLLEGFRAKKPAVSLIVLDACRDNPFVTSRGRSLGGSRGLADVQAPSGTFIMYSAGAGQRAIDRLSESDPDANSVYTRALLPKLKTPGLGIQEIAREVRREVMATARTVGHEQVPAYYDEVLGDFCPAGCTPSAAKPQPKTAEAADERKRLAKLELKVERLREEANRKKVEQEDPIAKYRGPYTGELRPLHSKAYVAFRAEVLVREGPGSDYASKFSIKHEQQVHGLGQVSVESGGASVRWIKFATPDGREGFVRDTDLLEQDSFRRWRNDLEDNRQIESYLERMRNATGPLAHVAGVYGMCSNLEERQHWTVALADLRLVWTEGSVFHDAHIEHARSFVFDYKYTPGRFAFLKDGVGRVRFYSMVSPYRAEKEEYGFTGKHMVYQSAFDRQYGWFKSFDKCGGADHATLSKIRALLALRAERWPKSPDVR